MPDAPGTTTTTTEGDGQGTAPETGSAPENAPGTGQGWMDSLPAEAQEEIRRLRGEAARYRSERNTIREEVTTMRQRIDAHDRQAVEAIAAERLHDPRDFLDRANLDDLRGEDGTINADAVKAGIDALVKDRPHLAIPAKPRSWGQGARSTPATDAPPSFGEALKNRDRA